MSITFVQTADPFRYYAMLQETSRTVRHYCLLNGFRYEQYVGVKRGHMLWQSTFNRAYLLYELLQRGVEGWVFYLDADAFIVDQQFDLAGFLADKSRYGAIFAGYITDIFDVNAGGFAVNLSHPAGQALIHGYHQRCEQLAGDEYHRALSWDDDVTDDQAILHDLLRSWCEERGFADAFLFERNDQSHVNNGTFISQQLRSLHRNFDARLAAIRSRVAQVMDDAPPVHPARTAGLYVPAAHPMLQSDCGIITDAGLVTTGKGGVFLRGPCARVAAGNHVVRVFGKADGVVRRSVVTCDAGERVLSAIATADTSTSDIMIEHRLNLTEPVSDFEVRIDAGEADRLVVKAVQIVAADYADPNLVIGRDTERRERPATGRPALSDVSQAYRLFLGREVESPLVAGFHINGAENIWKLIETVAGSAEARRRRLAEAVDVIAAAQELSPVESPSDEVDEQIWALWSAHRDPDEDGGDVPVQTLVDRLARHGCRIPEGGKMLVLETTAAQWLDLCREKRLSLTVIEPRDLDRRRGAELAATYPDVSTIFLAPDAYRVSTVCADLFYAAPRFAHAHRSIILNVLRHALAGIKVSGFAVFEVAFHLFKETLEAGRSPIKQCEILRLLRAEGFELMEIVPTQQAELGLCYRYVAKKLPSPAAADTGSGLSR